MTEAIIESGIHDAIAHKLNQQGKLSRRAVAEAIINNVRKTIIREHLTDPKFYDEMSKLLNDLIKQSREDTASYERFLEAAEALAKKLGKKNTASYPQVLTGHPEAIVLFNNLGSLPATIVPMPGGRRGKGEAGLGDRPDHAREGPGGLEGRRHAREAGAQRPLPPSGT